ncbi:MAG: hypothetical protein U9O59_02125, partial [Actinomycetota bacterium]|nr:hypothetical protein [Actinomycetota bacterium]
MAKYGGSWAKGFASTFDPIGGINLGLQWKQKKAKQKKIDDAMEQIKINSMELAAKFDRARADGTIDQQEYGDAISWAIPLGKEIMGKTKELYSNYQDMTPDQLQTELDNIYAVLDFSKDLDFANIEEMKAFGNKLTQPEAKMQWDLIIKSIEKRKAQPEDIWGQAGKLPQDIRAEYLRSKGVEIPESTPKVTDLNTAVNYLTKLVNLPPDKWNMAKAGLEKNTGLDLSAITQESLREPEAPIAETEAGPEYRTSSLPQQTKYKEKLSKTLTAKDWDSTIK